ncbi:uncharacterized protein LY89DRAFT_589322 [Mollisia scopiformis]|uniref:Uncharacterized protein n=1 Tax=Mollisia scopiformis TaxID=149040 RepID=A0A194X4T5_MOLSC|nr:uncharacterized protein LY89DRAFT_589322 [Mollisia scopiformis]KUJ15084.1 hypothetical protein LY89DRAFT_589322 [Mollisia scopiformis]
MSPGGFNTAHGPDRGPSPPNHFGGVGYPIPSPHVYQPPFQFGYAPMPPHFMPPQQFGMPQPAVAPNTDGDAPGTHLRNQTGGVGVPHGYNLLHFQEHCVVHVLKSKEKPWQLTSYREGSGAHQRWLVPVTMTVKEMMQQLGCNNADDKKNIMYECSEKGNGAWAHGLRLVMDDKDRMKKSIKDFGWDKTRTGMLGQRSVVWVWLTKEGL